MSARGPACERPDAWDKIMTMLEDVDHYDAHPGKCAARPYFGTYNSSFTFALLSDIDLQDYFGDVSSNWRLRGLPYPGWGKLVPGP